MQEIFRIPNRSDQNVIPYKIIIKILNLQNKERLLNVARVKKNHQVKYKGSYIKITHDFSIESLKAKRDQSDGLQLLKDYRPVHQKNLLITIDRERKIFHYKTNLSSICQSNSTHGTRREKSV